jgi:hypothetical protein
MTRCALLLTVAAAFSAHAAAPGVRGQRDSGESPRNVYFDLKLGGYFPRIDREPGLSGAPYETTFGAGATMLMFDVELQYYVYQGWGALGVGVSGGYAEKFAPARVVGSGEPSAEKTGLRVYPIRAVLGYRFDYPALHWHVPLVPYAKASLITMPWQAVTGNRVDTAVDAAGATLRGAGVRWGFGFTAGIALMLDFLEPRLARDFDTSVGVNHSYLLAELVVERVNNFGRGGLDLSSQRWMFGLALDF